MAEHSIRVQPIAVPVWLVMKPALIPPFFITPTRRKKTNPVPHSIQKMKSEIMNPAVIEIFQYYDAKEKLHGQ